MILSSAIIFIEENAKMPNYCYYEMKVIGSDDAIDELISMMKYSHPTHHFYRAFEADVYERGENYAFIIILIKIVFRIIFAVINDHFSAANKIVFLKSYSGLAGKDFDFKLQAF